uniref:Nuclear receptor domain-containing protein n=1 Tax=Caenorhabditis japonica TaxID=281687 RepID=A0A8R1HFX3_CAEJA
MFKSKENKKSSRFLYTPNKLETVTCSFGTYRCYLENLQVAPCLVCGAQKRVAFHFGSNSCTACASFFRRTVSFGIRFLCKADNQCTISSDIRFICRSCRYDNCIKAGMQRELVQEKRSSTRIPKYVIESREQGVKEVVRGYQTSKYVNFSDTTPSSISSVISSDNSDISPTLSTRSSSPENNDFEFSTILSTTHDELLQFYVNQVKSAALRRKLEVTDDEFQQFPLSKQINDKLALDLCNTCPGTDLLEYEDLQVLFRYCSFASLWMDSAWITACNSGRVDKQKTEQSDSTSTTSQSVSIDHDEKISSEKTIFNRYVNRFKSTITSELSRLKLDIVEYSALKSFCIWKLGLLDSTLTLKIVAQEQYYGTTTALSKYYLTMYRESLEMYDILGLCNSIADIVP